MVRRSRRVACAGNYHSLTRLELLSHTYILLGVGFFAMKARDVFSASVNFSGKWRVTRSKLKVSFRFKVTQKIKAE